MIGIFSSHAYFITLLFFKPMDASSEISGRACIWWWTRLSFSMSIKKDGRVHWSHWSLDASDGLSGRVQSELRLRPPKIHQNRPSKIWTRPASEFLANASRRIYIVPLTYLQTGEAASKNQGREANLWHIEGVGSVVFPSSFQVFTHVYRLIIFSRLSVYTNLANEPPMYWEMLIYCREPISIVKVCPNTLTSHGDGMFHGEI